MVAVLIFIAKIKDCVLVAGALNIGALGHKHFCHISRGGRVFLSAGLGVRKFIVHHMKM